MAKNDVVATNHAGTITQEYLNTPVTFEEAILESGLTEDQIQVVINPYKILNQNKDELLNVPFFVRLVRFPIDKTTGREYSVTYLVTKENKMYVMTDGSTGIYTQLVSIVNKREEDGHPTPDQSMFFANGLRKSVYIHEESGQEATTYYLA